MGQSERNGSQTIKSVETTFNLIESLKSLKTAGVSQLAEELDKPTSTIYVHLNTLRNLGYVIREERSYRLSLQFLEHGEAVRQLLEVHPSVHDEVNKIAYLTGEIAAFAVEEKGQRVITYRSKGEVGVGKRISVGEFTLMHLTSMGKAILAHLDDARVSAIIEQYGLPENTENTITDAEALHEELSLIRGRGFALDNEERRRGIRGVAVPVTDTDNEILGSVGIAGPRNRFQPRYLSELLEVLEHKRDLIEVRYDLHQN
jgi:DNA-binding IclR family transcriptional regulator